MTVTSLYQKQQRLFIQLHSHKTLQNSMLKFFYKHFKIYHHLLLFNAMLLRLMSSEKLISVTQSSFMSDESQLYMIFRLRIS